MLEYDFDTHEAWSTSDIVFGKLVGYTDDELLNDFENIIGSKASYETNVILPIGHYSSALSEFVYQIPSIVIYVNVDSSTLYLLYFGPTLCSTLLYSALLYPTLLSAGMISFDDLYTYILKYCPQG